MSAILLLLPLSLSMACVAVAAFHWANRAGQFDDLDKDAFNPLFEEAALAEPAPGDERA